ncbi:MAG: response regulator [Melioribacter sp.]|nr:response regulator [Melioribacter sp.]
MINKLNSLPKLLIVEDDLENQKFLYYFLKKHFRIEICDSAEMCYDLLFKERSEIILMDISIRGYKNGLDLTKELKNHPLFSKIPIVCYTAHAYNEDRINSIDAGCDAYISKPTNYNILLNTLLKLIQESNENKHLSIFDHN